MSTVVVHGVVSLDGFVADLHDDPGPLFDWYFNGDQHLTAQDVLGTGKRHFGSVSTQHLLEDPHVVVRGDRVLHLQLRVRR